MISIIIPFYNSCGYLNQCIDCLLKQTYTDFEAIFINDGSSDNYKEIFNMIDDSRIKLIEQKNSGVSSARNNGLKNAKGKYICFLDVDDVYKNNYLEKMVETIVNNDCDVVLCNYEEKYKSSVNIVKYHWKNEILDKNDIHNIFIPTLLSNLNSLKEFNRCLVWRTMIKANIAKNIKFDEKVSTAEDLLYLIEIYSLVENIYFLDDSLYIYNRYSGTTLDKFQDDLLNKQIYLHEKIIEILNKYSLYNNLFVLYQNNRLKMYTSMLSNAVRTNRNNALNLINDITNNYKKDIIMNDIKPNSFIEFLNIIFMKLKCNYLLYFIYSLKEKNRRKRLKG